MTTALINFEQHQKHLKILAYRMLGSIADAEDIVQETWLKCQDIDFQNIISAKAYLTQITSRLCLDYIKSARMQREKYVGVWLPEPQIEYINIENIDNPLRHLETADDVSYALLLTLEKLQPAERAAFLLHDVFDFSFDDIATILERTTTSCRKLASRARIKIRENKTNTGNNKHSDQQLTAKFLKAVKSGDLNTLVEHLAKDATLTVDGGGLKTAIIKPIYGKDKIYRFFTGIMSKNPTHNPDDIQLISVNGGAGILIKEVGGDFQTWHLEWSNAEKIAALNIIRNPEKLQNIPDKLL